jgi:excisionase family DNA binding protein
MEKKTEEVSPVEAARRLGIDPGYLYLQLRAGRIVGRKEGRRWLIPTSAIESRLKAREQAR